MIKFGLFNCLVHLLWIYNISARANVTLFYSLKLQGECDKNIYMLDLCIGNAMNNCTEKKSDYIQPQCAQSEKPSMYFIFEKLINSFDISVQLKRNGKTGELIEFRNAELPLNTEKVLASKDLRHFLQVTSSYKCLQNYYGDLCERFCEAMASRHSCDENGNKICEKNYILNTERDICIYDVCSTSPDYCANKGKCVNPLDEQEKPQCSCPNGYIGSRCEAIVTDYPQDTSTQRTTSSRIVDETTKGPEVEEDLLPPLQEDVKDILDRVGMNTKNVKIIKSTTQSYTILIGIFVISTICIMLGIILGVIILTACRRKNSAIKINSDLIGPPNMNNIFQQSPHMQTLFYDGHQFANNDEAAYYQKPSTFIDPRGFNTLNAIEPYNYQSDTIRSHSSNLYIKHADYYPSNETDSMIMQQNKTNYSKQLSTSIQDDLALSELYSKYNASNNGTIQHPAKYSFMHSSITNPNSHSYYMEGNQSATLNKRHSQINFLNYPVSLNKQFSDTFYDTWKTPYSEFLLKDFPNDQGAEKTKAESKDSRKSSSPKPPVEFLD